MAVPKIILFGDSLTEWSFSEDDKGYGWALQQYYGDRVKVVNEGFAGYNTKDVGPEFTRIIKQIEATDAPPTLLFSIFLGANDAVAIPYGVPLKEFATNITSFVEDILNRDILKDVKIVLITPPPISIKHPTLEPQEDIDRLKDGMRYKTYKNKKLFADKIMTIANEFEKSGHPVVGVDFWKALTDSALEHEGQLEGHDHDDENRWPGCGLPTAIEFPKGYFSDGLHFKHRAYEVLTKVFKETVLKKWPELSKESIKR